MLCLFWDALTEYYLFPHLMMSILILLPAEALNIRRNTARAHLRSIFSKTGVRRQTELVRIFLNSVVLLGSGENEAE